MALREFTDTAGRTWQVWDTVPETAHEEQIFRQSTRLQADAERRATDDEPGAAVLPNRRFGPGREGGWLTFMTSTSGGEDKRRPQPDPSGLGRCDRGRARGVHGASGARPPRRAGRSSPGDP